MGASPPTPSKSMRMQPRFRNPSPGRSGTQQRPALVVIDPLFRLAHIRDEKAYAEVYAALGPLIDLAREMGTHPLDALFSQVPKVDPIDSPLGSTAIGGGAATTIVLSRRSLPDHSDGYADRPSPA